MSAMVDVLLIVNNTSKQNITKFITLSLGIICYLMMISYRLYDFQILCKK